MPGIFGLVLNAQDPAGAPLAEALAADLCLYPWQTATAVETEPGRVFLGAAANGPQPSALAPFVHREPGLACVIDGVITRTRRDGAAGPLVAATRYAAAVAATYREVGAGFAEDLEGQFTAIVHDEIAGQLIVGNDRNGLVPLYRYRDGRGFFFCSLLGPMAASGFFAPQLDPAAVSTMMGHHHLFYRQSLVAGVRLYDPATVTTVTVADGGCETRRYWYFGRDGGRDAAVPFARRIDGVCDTLVAASERMTARPLRMVASLSGGLDSRLVTGLAQRRRPDLQAWTFGTEDAADRRIAAQICALTGMGQRIFPTDAALIPRHADDFVAATNGCATVHHAFWFERCHALREEVDISLNGYRGGVVLGDAIVGLGLRHELKYLRDRLRGGRAVVHPWLERNRSDSDLIRYYLALSHQPHPALGPCFAAPEPPLTEVMAAAFADAMGEVSHEFRLEQWSEEYGGGRHMTLLGVVGDRHFYGDASLFYDYDVRDRCFGIPPSERRGRRAYIAILKRLLPDLADVPYANTGLPATTPARQVDAVTVWRRLRGRRWVPSTGNDADAWSRLPAVREFYGDLLRSQAARERPYWNGAAIGALFEAHHRGEVKLATELGDLMAVELFARRWIDGKRKQLP